jgi:hypothetical protein
MECKHHQEFHCACPGSSASEKRADVCLREHADQADDRRRHQVRRLHAVPERELQRRHRSPGVHAVPAWDVLRAAGSVPTPEPPLGTQSVSSISVLAAERISFDRVATQLVSIMWRRYPRTDTDCIPTASLPPLSLRFLAYSRT